MPGSAMLEPLPVAAGYVPALLLYPGLDGHPAHFLPDRRPLRLKLAGRPAFGKPCLLRELLTHALSIFTLFSLPRLLLVGDVLPNLLHGHLLWCVSHRSRSFLR